MTAKHILIIVLAVITAFILVIGLSMLGIDIPVLQQLLGFILLTFIPGLQLLLIFRVRNINPVEYIAYALGLSLALIMFTGAFINFALPYVGIGRPLATIPVTVSILAITIILAILAYLRNRTSGLQLKIILPARASYLPALAFMLLILLTILGAAMVTAFQNNVILIICLLFIALAILMISTGKFIKTDLFPLAIFSFSLCILYQTTLISPYLVGSDIFTEYVYQGLVAQAGAWDYSMGHPVNTCLSIVIAAPVYAQFLNIDSIWVFKAIYPLLFSLMPVAMYRALRIQIGPEKAFLAVFLFLSIPTFALEMISLCRQQVAELFFILVILLLCEKRLPANTKIAMSVIFSASIAVSHYALGFITMIYYGLALVSVLFMRSKYFLSFWGWVTSRTGGLPDSLTPSEIRKLPISVVIVPAIAYFIIAFIWYRIVGSGINLEFLSGIWTTFSDALTRIVVRVLTGAGSLLDYARMGQADLLVKIALGMDFGQVSWLGKSFRVLQYAVQILTVTGCLRMIIWPKGINFRLEFLAISLISAALLVACIVIPDFSSLLNATRWYHLAMITLSPFCIVGGQTIWQAITLLIRKLRNNPCLKSVPGVNQGFFTALTALILVPYFLISSGLFFEITRQDTANSIDAPYSIALTSYRLDLAGIFNLQDGAAARWLGGQREGAAIFTDHHARKIFSIFKSNTELLDMPRDGVYHPGYLYLSSWNNIQGEMSFATRGKPGLREHLKLTEIPGLHDHLNNSDRVYVNGGAAISLLP